MGLKFTIENAVTLRHKALDDDGDITLIFSNTNRSVGEITIFDGGRAATDFSALDTYQGGGAATDYSSLDTYDFGSAA
ncbi:MAG: hypothetical protein ACPHCN_17215 [Mycobacterium sp.]